MSAHVVPPALLLGVGALVSAIGAYYLHRIASVRAQLVPVRVGERHHGWPTDGTPGPIMLFQRLDGPSLEPGDEVQVRIEEDRGQVYDATGWHYAIASLIYGALLMVMGLVCLLTDLRGSFDTAGDAATYVVTSMVFGSIGIAAAVAIAKMVSGLRGSRVVVGTVVDSTVESAAYIGSLNRAKVRYDLDGQSRAVWATPKVRARKAGSSCRVRITGAVPPDVVRTTPMAIAGLVLVTAFGLAGLVLLSLLPLV